MGLQEYHQYFLLTAIALETIGGLLFLLNRKSGATLLVRTSSVLILFAYIFIKILSICYLVSEQFSSMRQSLQ